MWDWIKKKTPTDSNWWFGENSIWGKSGLSKDVSEGTEKGISNIFGGGIQTQNEVNLGSQEKAILIGIVIALLVFRK